MPKASIKQTCQRVAADIQAQRPAGQEFPKQTFLGLLLNGYDAPSLSMAEEMLATGILIGLWSKRHDPKARAAFVYVKGRASTQPAPGQE